MAELTTRMSSIFDDDQDEIFTTPKRGMNRNVIAGLIIVGGIFLLTLAIFVFPKVTPGKLTFTIQFQDAKGLKAGDVIYFKGVKIGDVKKVKLSNKQVLARVAIDFEEDIPEDTVFFIWPDKLISGKQCIQVKLGNDSTLIKKNDIVQGESSYPSILLRVGKEWLDSL